jgi:phosphoserine phosphatase
MADWYLTAGSSVINRFVPINNWAPNASLGIELLINGGWHVAIASVTWKFAVEKVAEKLGIADVLATGLHWESGSIDHVFPEDKARFMKQLALKRGIPMSRVAAVGDSSGDYPMLTAACHGIFVGTEEPALPDVAHMPNAAIDQIAEYVLGLPVD